MGTLDLENDKHYRKVIDDALGKRGLILDDSEDWEVHGPHQEMNYQVYIGWAYRDADPKVTCNCPGRAQLTSCGAHKQFYCVAIYPEEVYEIDDYDRWYDVSQEDEILIDEKI